MGDVLSTHLDDSRRQYISEKTGKILKAFFQFYEDQYGVALFNSMRYEIEGTGGPQAQLLWRKVPLDERVIFSGNLFQYLEDSKKWRNRFSLVPHNYGLVLYENKAAYERQIPPRAIINSAGYKILTSVDHYLELVSNSLPGPAPKSGAAPILKCPTQYPLILWHPYSRHYYFCVMTEPEQEKWLAVFQDCVRHCNNGIPEDSKVEGPAFTDAIRMYRQSKEQYGTWEMLCGNEVQISDAVYRMVYEQTQAHFEAVAAKCEMARPAMESTIRTDMDQIITSKEHLASKIRAFILPKAEVCVRNHVQPYIPSILEALMIPTSQGFTEVRDVFFKEVTDMNLNVINEGGIDKLGEYMEKLSQLAYHPVKMQSCYEKMDQLKLEGLQQRFDVSSASVFKQRAQIHMREQMDNAVYTFETLLHQELGKGPTKEELCKSIQRILERVLKKYDYDSSTVRKKFFREALLQITIPFLLKKLAPTCKSELPRFQELIFEDFARFILVENTYEEVVLQTVMKDIMQAVKEAAVQRKHNLYRDSMVMHNSDPNLHLLAEGVPIDWGEEYSSGSPGETDLSAEKRRRAKQVVSVIHDEEAGLPYEPSPEALSPGVPPHPASPESVSELRGLLVQELQVDSPQSPAEPLTNGTSPRESPQPPEPESERRPSQPASPLNAHHEPAPSTPGGEAVSPASPPHRPCPEAAADGDHPKPSDQETGEEVSGQGGHPYVQTTTEDSTGVQTEF
uniref:Niban apoptosis regulator 2 n=1 Tax=Sarcophilus harrisii TaxID=9305 RepID=A0A7N4PLY5_SARHA